MSNRVVLRRRASAPAIAARPVLRRSVVAAARNVLRRGMRRYARRQVGNLAQNIVNDIRARRAQRHYRNRGINPNRRVLTVTGRASGTTHTTSRLITHKTTKHYRQMRKYFKNHPVKQVYVNRFGFGWMGATAASKTIWYSICHLKFNNLSNYMLGRITQPTLTVGTNAAVTTATQQVGNNPDSVIYIGKCTFQYELYNPTNYLITVYIYDLVCRRDTPYPIDYSNAESETNSAPEACMQKGSKSLASDQSPHFYVGDPTHESTNTYWNSVGMKPTDYHLFNTLWKVKGMKKIVLPPGTSHHHNVIYRPHAKITNASLFYPRETFSQSNKNGVAGITQATLFGFQGQVAIENNVTEDTTAIGTLPGKIIVNCIKKVAVYNLPLAAKQYISENNLLGTWNNPTVMTDLTEQPAAAT